MLRIVRMVRLLRALPVAPLISGGLTSVATRLAKRVAQGLVCREVEKRALLEAEAQAARLLRETRNGIYLAIVWQNALLLASIWLSLHLGSVLPFCVSYVVVASYSLWCVAQHRQYIFAAIRTRSLFAVLRAEVRDAIVGALQQLGTIERFVVTHLGPDLEVLSDKVARQVYPAVRSACVNLGVTLGLSFLVFRVWLVPALARGLLH